MTFSEFLILLHPFCAGEDGKRKGEFTAIIIDRIMEDGSSDSCPTLDAQKAFLRSIYAGRENLPLESAKAMLAHIDKERFSEFVQDRLSEITVDSVDSFSKTLTTAGYQNCGTCESVGFICADIYEQILVEITGSLSTPNIVPLSTGKDQIDDAVLRLREMIEGIRPPEVMPPENVSSEETVYVSALYAAYGSACNVLGFCEEQLALLEYSNYREDFIDRRIDYFAAEAIKRGVQEVFNGQFSDQFEVLKQETYDGIKNTVRRRFPDGYERMLAVMEQAVRAPVEQYLFAHTAYWIGNSIRCGMCHHLVNEGRIKWI